MSQLNKESLFNSIKLFFLATILMMLAVQVVNIQAASAMFNRSPDHGYFEGKAGADGQRDYVNPGGIGVTNVDSFISWYKTKLSGNSQERAMASFTIRTMLGQNRGAANEKGSVPSGTVAEWEKRVRSYADPNAKDRSVSFNKSFHFKKNTYYQMNNNDIGWYYETDTQPAIVFTNPDGTTYAIKRSCANPVGELAPLDEDSEWSLKDPLTEVRKNGGAWSKQVGVKPGDTVTTRYHVSNATRTATDRFERWRSMNFQSNGTITSSWRDGSKSTEASLGGLGTITAGESSFTIPSNAQSRTAYCWRASVDPRASNDNRVLTGAPACAVVGGSDEQYPSWSLTVGSSVHPFVEQGNAVGWWHGILNSDPNNRGGKTADGFTRCMVFSYDRYDPNGSWGGGGVCGTNHKASIPPGGAYQQTDDAYVLQTDGGTSLGATYCQRYSVGRQAEFKHVVGESPNACTTVVGGKTRLSMTPAQPSRTVEPSRTATVSAVLRTENYTTAGGYPGYDIACTYNVTATLPNNAGQTILGNTDCTTSINNGDARTVVQYPYTPTEGDIGKEICVNVYIAPRNGNMNLLDGSIPPVQRECFDVVAKPYIKVSGGDIAAARCDGGGAIIAGWNQLSDDGNAGSAGNHGAGAQYAAYAQGVIHSFASGQYIAREAGYGYSPVNLSFANTDTNTGAGNFGGNFGGTPCPSRYYDSSAINAASDWPGMGTAIGNGGTRTYRANATASPLVIGGATIPANVNTRLYVDGDVILSGDINANYAGAIDIAQIPNFTLIVRGNIYVQPNVRTLNGTFITEGNGKGQLYTCSTMTSPIRSSNFSNSRPVPAATPYSTCGNQLNFTGSVVAKKIHLQRTYGSMFKDVSQAAGAQWSAETFKYNPLTWILGSTGVTSTSEDQYDSITTLPPVL